MAHSAAVALCLAWALIGQPDDVPGAAPGRFAVGKVFERALEQPISFSSAGSDLRSVLRRVESERRIAILLDRRFDPNRAVEIPAVAGTLGGVLEQLTEPSQGLAVAIGNTLYVGPAPAAAKLRTLVKLREAELFDAAADDRRRRQDLSARAAFAWQDLDRPADLVRRLCEQHHLEVAGLDRVPHDLWAGGELPQASLIEALSLVLVQFDLTFAWTEGASGVRLEPLPERVAIEQRHRPPRGMTAAAAARKWRVAFPQLEFHDDKGEVVVSGTVEDHTAIDRAAQPEKSPRTPPLARENSLELQRFTLKIQDAPLRQVMKTLADAPGAQFEFEYDAAAVNRAGIDLDQKIDVEVKTADVDKLLAAIFQSTGLEVTREGRIVRLKPASR